MRASRRLGWAPGVWLVLVPLLSVTQARAQADEPTCGQGQAEVEFLPFSAARDVALNTHVSMRFSQPVDLAVVEDPFELMEVTLDVNGEIFALDPVPGALQRLTPDTWLFVPDRQLTPDTHYSGRVVTSDAVGRFAGRTEATFDFTTGRTLDESAPRFTFDGGSVEVRSKPAEATCGRSEGSYSVSLEFTQASDDGSDGSLEYLLFLTRAGGLEGPARIARASQLQAGEGRNQFDFVLGPQQVETPVCVAAVATDGVGHRTEGGTFCFDPIQGSFFHPVCSAAEGGHPGAGYHAGGLGALVLAGTLWCRRRRNRLRRREVAAQPLARER